MLVKVDAKEVKNPEVFRSLLQTKNAGEAIQMTILRNKETKELTARLAATSRVMQAGQKRAVMGVQVDDADDGKGAVLKVVTAGLPADKAGLKVGDVILKIDDKALVDGVKLTNILGDHKPGDTLSLLVKPQGKEKEKTIKVVLVADQETVGKGKGGKGGGLGAGWDNRNSGWKKDNYKLAIIGIEYPDVKHNAKITAKDWEDAMFSTKHLHQDERHRPARLRQHERLLPGAVVRQAQGRGQGASTRSRSARSGASTPPATPAPRRPPCSPRRWTSS